LYGYTFNLSSRKYGVIVKDQMSDKPKRDVGSRLRAIRKKLGMNQSVFAKALGGCSQGFVSDIEVGRSAPSALVVAGVEQLGFSSHWLMCGEGEMQAPADRVRERPLPYGLKEIPLVGEVAAGLSKSIPDDDVERMLPIYLGEHAGCQCFASKVTGRSMEPLFRAGDIVVVDKTCPPDNNDIVVAAIEDQVMLKRVSVAPDAIYLLSTSENVPPVRVDRRSASAHVVGKVIQLIRSRF